MRSERWVVAVAWLVAAAGVVRAQQPAVRLTGDAGPDAVRLAWSLEAWPAGLQAFELRRRAPGAGPWEAVTVPPVVPGNPPGKDLANVEPDAAERARLERKRDELLRAGRLKHGTLDDLARAATAPPTGQPGDALRALRMVVSQDHDLALLLGFGAVDRAVPLSGPREYGLFLITDAAPAPAQPAATFTAVPVAADDPALRASDLAAAREAEGIVLRWRVEDAAARRASITGFVVTRRDADGERVLAPQGVGATGVTEGWRQHAFVDTTAEAGRRYTYAVSARTALGRVLGPGAEVVVEPAATAVPAPDEAPRIESAAVDAARGVVVTWTFPRAREAAITGFRLARGQVGVDAAPQLLPATPGPQEREAADDARFDRQKAWYYLVLAVNGDATVAASAPFLFTTIELPAPPRPTGLKATWVPRGRTGVVHLRWDPKAAGDQVTRTYALFADHPRVGEVVAQASAGTVRDPEAFLELPGVEGREYVVGVAGVGAGGQVGERVEVRLFVPGLVPAPPSAVEVARAGQGAVVRWKHPGSPDLAGFRVSAGGVVLADEETLGPGASQWRLPSIDPATTYELGVRAVSRSGEVSRLVTAALPSASPPPPARPTAPAGLSAAWTQEGAETRLVLTWDAARASPDTVGYEVAWDEAVLLELSAPRAAQVTQPGRCVLAAADPGRTYHVHLRAVSSTGAKSVFSVARCLGQGRTLPPAVLDDTHQLVRDDEGVKATWRWSYDPAPALAGFRLVHETWDPDARTYTRVQEARLPADAREWTSGALARRTVHRFSIEALDAAGVASERGPGRVLRHNRRD